MGGRNIVSGEFEFERFSVLGVIVIRDGTHCFIFLPLSFCLPLCPYRKKQTERERQKHLLHAPVTSQRLLASQR